MVKKDIIQWLERLINIDAVKDSLSRQIDDGSKFRIMLNATLQKINDGLQEQEKVTMQHRALPRIKY